MARKWLWVQGERRLALREPYSYLYIMEKTPKRPGWGIIERYMGDATPEAQEAAYENLRGLMKRAVEIDGRLVAEEAEKRRVFQPPLW